MCNNRERRAMSRHKIPLRDGVRAESAWIGWDRPLNTFFAQVLGLPDAEGEQEELVWAGTSYSEMTKAAEAVRVLEPWCDIDAGMVARLEIDRMATLARQDGPNQIEAKSFMTRLETVNRIKPGEA